MIYYTKTEIAIETGDTVRHTNLEGVVVANLDTSQYTEDFTEEIWGYLETGFIAVFKGMGIIHFPQVDDTVEFVSRKT